MTKREKIRFIIDTLEELYPDPPIPLAHKDPYTLLIAVILSAQCTDARVNQITPLLFAKADNPYDMVKLSQEEIQEIIRPVGLSPNESPTVFIIFLIFLLDKYNGEVPKSFEALEALPSVGHKTASVVMSTAFGVPAFPVDTHIHRMLFRWGISDGTTVTKSENDAKKAFPKSKWNKLHLQIIYYAREYSPARGWDITKDIITQALMASKKK